MIVLGIDPGTANTGYGVVRAPGRAPGGARRRRHRDLAGARPGARGSPTIHARVGELIDEHRPDGDGGRGALLRRQRALGVRGRPGARRRAARRRPARHPVLLLHAAAGQGRRLRLRPRRQGPGAADGPGAARARRSCRGPTTRPTRSRSRSATPTARRCARALAGGRGAMIALVAARSPSAAPDHVVVSCGGVGYRLAVSAETLRQVPAAGKPATLHTHLIVRDDALLLYGFATEEERDLFLLLLGVQSVGPKVALAVLSRRHAARAARRASPPATPRASRPCPGIGKRTAERIIVELREKVGAAPRRRPDRDRPRRRPARARPRRPRRARLLAQEADELLDGAAGETPEDLIADALQGARR